MMARRILILVPHPDDEVVGCAAAVARARREGARLFGLYLTRGIPPRDALWPWRRPRYREIVARRREEARHVAARLGIEVLHFSDRPSRRLKNHLVDAMAEFRRAVAESAAEMVWAPAFEGAHQDHDAANFLAARGAGTIPVCEFAEYNFASGVVRSQRFPDENGEETVLRLSAQEKAEKRALLALYRSERRNLAHIRTEVESFRPLPAYDYTGPPHAGTLFCERFHWLPFRHPRIDSEPRPHLHVALSTFRG
jgi:LmbE family N-acetylglucosaminyl deacetylase